MQDFLGLAQMGPTRVALASVPIFALAHLRQARAQERIAEALARGPAPSA